METAAPVLLSDILIEETQGSGNDPISFRTYADENNHMIPPSCKKGAGNKYRSQQEIKQHHKNLWYGSISNTWCTVLVTPSRKDKAQCYFYYLK